MTSWFKCVNSNKTVSASGFPTGVWTQSSAGSCSSSSSTSVQCSADLWIPNPTEVMGTWFYLLSCRFFWLKLIKPSLFKRCGYLNAHLFPFDSIKAAAVNRRQERARSSTSQPHRSDLCVHTAPSCFCTVKSFTIQMYHLKLQQLTEVSHKAERSHESLSAVCRKPVMWMWAAVTKSLLNREIFPSLQQTFFRGRRVSLTQQLQSPGWHQSCLKV